MDIIQGRITELGNTLSDNLNTTYSYITIGERMVQQVAVPRGLDNFLKKGLQMDGETALYLIDLGKKKLALGIKTPDGKLYYHHQGSGLGIFMILAGIPLMIALIGFLFIYHCFKLLQVANVSGELERMGAIKIT